MKKVVLISGYRSFFYSMLFFLFFISCKKDTANTKEGEGTLVFNINGIEPVQDEFGKQAASSLSKVTYVSLSTDFQNLDNVDLGVQTSVDNMSTSFGERNFSLNGNASKINKSAAVPVDMDAGIKYVILLYNKTTNHTEFIGQATVGQALVIDAVKGQEYDWYAYSYNTTADITLPTSIDDVIDTPTDTELLYAKGTTSISTTVLNTPIPILFKHKLAEIVFEVDSDRLFGTLNTDIVMNFKFINDISPLTKGKFSLKTGETSNIESYTKPIVLQVSTTDANVRIARFYVADVTKKASFSIDFSNLKATYLNNVEQMLVASNAIRNTSFVWPEDISLGKRYIGKLKLWYKFPERTILHVTRTAAEGYGYAAQPYSANGTTLTPANNRASYNLISEPKNYGSLTESVVRSGGFRSVRCYANGTLNTF